MPGSCLSQPWPCALQSCMGTQLWPPEGYEDFREGTQKTRQLWGILPRSHCQHSWAVWSDSHGGQPRLCLEAEAMARATDGAHRPAHTYLSCAWPGIYLCTSSSSQRGYSLGIRSDWTE